MTGKTVIAILVLLLIAPICMAQNSQQGDSDEAVMLDSLHRMRVKQQEEEHVVRAQIFKTVQQEQHCTPVQQTRQRIRDVEARSGDTSDDDIIINAGHEELNVTDNHGTINADVNVQIVKQGNDMPCP